MKNALILIGCCLVTLGCATTTPATTDTATPTAATATTATPAPTPRDADMKIRAATARWVSAFNAGDFDTVATFYAPDAVVMAPTFDIVRGPSGARQLYGSMASAQPTITIRPEKIEQSCDQAFEYGTYEIKMKTPDASNMNDRGKYITVWRRMPDGEWKIIGDIFNTSMPAPGM